MTDTTGQATEGKETPAGEVSEAILHLHRLQCSRINYIWYS